jgi:signal transduction histidine kinase
MNITKNSRGRWRWELALAASILVCVAVLVASEIGHQRLQTGYNSAVTEMRASAKLAELLGYVADAETGQRGFLLTKRENYLDSYRAVQPKILALTGELRDYFSRSADPQAPRDFAELVQLIGQKNSEMELTINLVRQGKAETAGEITGSNIGKEKMDQIRGLAATLQQRERERTAAMIGSWEFNRNLSRFAVALVVALNIVLLVVLFGWLKRDWAHEQKKQARKQQDLLDEQARLDRLVAERSAQLEMLATHIQQVSENEKSALARELHDELGAILTASKMDVAWVRQHLTPDQSALAEKLARAMKNLDQGVQAKRRIIENLRPTSLTSFGLVVALGEYADQVQEQNGWHMNLELPEDDFTLPEDASIALFRITQEALTNAAKYAKAQHIRISLACDGHTAELEIEDDGVGFVRGEGRPKSHGLAGMRQRMMGLNGSLEIDSEPGRGTRVRALLPLAISEAGEMEPVATVLTVSAPEAAVTEAAAPVVASARAAAG